MLKTLILIIEYLFIILPVLIGVAYMTLVEREILASIQRRKGPNVVGVAGILQPYFFIYISSCYYICWYYDVLGCFTSF